jgi:ribonuclease BN (tRNA processing enzyme)
MQLQMLGTGSAFAKKRFNTNALVRSKAGFTLLIDAGYTATLSMYQLGMQPGAVHAILITHIHGDHIAGLEELGFLSYFLRLNTPLYIAEELVTPLWEDSLRGAMIQPGIEKLADVFDVRPLQPNTAVTIADGLTVELIPTRHVAGKPAYSVYLNGHIYYSADTVFRPDVLHDLVTQRGCDVLLHEVQLHGHPLVHTALAELSSLPAEMQEKTYLMHYDDDVEDFMDQLGQMQLLEQHRTYDF